MMIVNMLSPLQHLEQVSLTTMEDVFLNIGELSEHDIIKHVLTAAASRKGGIIKLMTSHADLK